MCFNGVFATLWSTVLLFFKCLISETELDSTKQSRDVLFNFMTHSVVHRDTTIYTGWFKVIIKDAFCLFLLLSLGILFIHTHKLPPKHLQQRAL